MDESRKATIIVLGEGKTEEGESFRRPGSPGDPMVRDDLGALHVLVERVLQKRCGIEPLIVWPPRIRAGRRSGNPGFLHDLQGRPRRYSERVPMRSPRGSRPWLSACAGRTAADLVVLVKDACTPGNAEQTRIMLQESLIDVPDPLAVIIGAFTPSIEGWLLPIDEAERLDEREAKERWNTMIGTGSVTSKIQRSREVDLDEIISASPDGFAPLVRELEDWAGSFGRS